MIQNYLHTFDSASYDPLNAFLQHACKITKRFVKDNPDTIIVQSDKGKQTVIMYENDYNSKMLHLLSDENTYKPTKTNPTSGFQKQNNDLVNRLLNLELIDSTTAYQLRTLSSHCPRKYGLPKAHKQDLPLRPVVPNIGGPSYMLSKYIGRIVRASIECEYNVTDSFSFCEYINTVRLPPSYILISLDVVSLFTCIPRSLVIHTIITKWDRIKRHTKINLDFFIEIVNFCMECSYFSFRGQYFKQISGTAMGNPFSPTAADLVMELLLEEVVERLNFPLPLLKKYVDDLILAVPADKVEEVLDVFNSYDSNLQFTCEREEEGRIPYLDMVLVRKADQSIKTEWYSKPMASGRFLDFFSCHPLHMKMNVVANFIMRVRKLSTNLPPKAINDIINEHLKVNHYPLSLRNRLQNRLMRKNVQVAPAETLPTTYKPMPYIDRLTARIKKSLRIDFPEITLATRNEHTINHLFTNTKH
ncbi:uncharacterized protein LOC129725997 [Wyeomyia smithii]|uniref:uncharacterized protein LOC129725997 n=1 Tax=Wyeomyia smithii TaxID=174621 RepID=UPI002468177C|nr:uncharacterized protein LOC129725997 [Wyeomyia smithii]